MQGCALHQLEWGRVDLAVVEVDLLIKLHLLPLCNLQEQKNKTKKENTEEHRDWGSEINVTAAESQKNSIDRLIEKSNQLYSIILRGSWHWL